MMDALWHSVTRGLVERSYVFVAPTKLLSEQPRQSIAASQLKMGEHFEEVETAVNFGETLGMKVVEFFGNPKSLLRYQKHVSKCTTKIYEKSDRVLNSPGSIREAESRVSVISNEATLRYVVGDPLMDMLCDVEGLKVIREESIETQQSQNSSSSLAIPSTGSCADYTCYTLRKDQRIVAVVIETKMDSSTNNVRAQVMGYVSAFTKVDNEPPLAIVLTEKRVEFLLFPFVCEGTGIGRCLLRAAIVSFDLWTTDNCEINVQALYTLLSLVSTSTRCMEVVSDCNQWEEMRNIESVITYTMSMEKKLAELQELLQKERVEKEKERVEKEKERVEKEKERVEKEKERVEKEEWKQKCLEYEIILSTA